MQTKFVLTADDVKKIALAVALAPQAGLGIVHVAQARIPRGLAGIDHAGSDLLRQHDALPDPWGINRAKAGAVPERAPCYGHAR